MSRDLEFAKTQNYNGDWAWGSKFAGIPLCCNYYVFDIMSRLIDENPQIKGIVEMGTHTGGMAVYLGLCGIQKGITVNTWEITKQISKETDTMLDKLGVIQHVFDVFAYSEKVIEQINKEPIYFLADGGDKKRELALFVPHLVRGSIVSVHDWGMEVTFKDLEAVADRLLPIRPEEWGQHNAQIASFLVR